MKKRILSMLAVLLLLGSVALTAFASEIPDLTKNGSITFTMDWENKPLNSGSLSIYRVGIIAADKSLYHFELIDALKDSKLSLEKVDDPNLAKDLAILALKKNLTEIKTHIKNGKAVFPDVAPGLYVVMQNAEDASNGFAPINPFLISVPQYENGVYELDVTADPKVPFESIPTDPTKPKPTKPTGPTLPQTGQLNWPVPLLAVSGVALFAVGWILFSGRKKDDYEK